MSAQGTRCWISCPAAPPKALPWGGGAGVLGRLRGVSHIPAFPVGEGRRGWGVEMHRLQRRCQVGYPKPGAGQQRPGVQLDVPGSRAPEHRACPVGSPMGTGTLGLILRATPCLPPLCPAPSVPVNA